MKRLLLTVLTGCSLISLETKAQEVIKKKGYTLTFESNYGELDPKLRKRMIETFFEVYPKLAKEYNANTLKEVKFFVDTAYKGVAATANGRVIYASNWMKTHPEDIDVVTHEVMHIVQNYGRSLGPGWLTEGIADFARYKFGVDNPGSKWTLPDLKPTHHYKNSYRITARFFAWIESEVKPGTVKEVDKSLRERTYTADIWKNITGKDIDELWAQYVKDPSI